MKSCAPQVSERYLFKSGRQNHEIDVGWREIEFMTLRLLTWAITWMVILLSKKGDKMKEANRNGGEGGELVNSL